MAGRDVIIIGPPIAKPIEGQEHVGGSTQTEVAADTHGHAAVVEARPVSITRRWWQWRPAAISGSGAPAHQRRSPSASRHPNPANAGRTGPAPVMEWSPSPGIIRIPIPAGIAPQPTAAVRIRAP